MEPLDLAALYEERLLILLENSEDREFHQVLLNPQQFKKVSDLIVSFFEKEEMEDLKPGHEVFELQVSERSLPSELFNGFNSIQE